MAELRPVTFVTCWPTVRSVLLTRSRPRSFLSAHRTSKFSRYIKYTDFATVMNRTVLCGRAQRVPTTTVAMSKLLNSIYGYSTVRLQYGTVAIKVNSNLFCHFLAKILVNFARSTRSRPPRFSSTPVLFRPPSWQTKILNKVSTPWTISW